MWDVIGHLPIWLQATTIIGSLIIIFLPVCGITYWIVKKMDKLKILGKVEAEDSDVHNEQELPVKTEVKP